jgi:DNA-binding NtrC family response regulator
MLDLRLPGMDGLTFLGRFRMAHPQTPVIILTGVGELAAAQQAIRHGVSDFLTKPCHLGEIEQALNRARLLLAPQPPSAADAESIVDSTTTSAEARSMSEIEQQAIIDALHRHRGNRTAAAAELGISRRTLYNRMMEYQQSGTAPR